MVEEKEATLQEVMDNIKELSTAINSIHGRVNFALGEISKLKEDSKGVLPVAPSNAPQDIVDAVHEILGPDFGVETNARKDSPFYEVTILVPERLAIQKVQASEEELKRKPELERLINEARDQKKKDELYRELMLINDKIPPIDKRAIVVSVTEGLNTVREYCYKVKKNIFMTHAKRGESI